MKNLYENRDIYEAAQKYRFSGYGGDQSLVRQAYEEMIDVIAQAAIEEKQHGPYRPEIGVVARVFQYYLEQMGKSQMYTLTKARQEKGVARLRECMRKTGGNMTNAEEMMKICIDTMAKSKFHMGDNPSKREYNNWESNLFSSEEQMERWLEEAQRG